MNKKRVTIVSVVLVALLLVGVLFVPYKTEVLQDGGSRVHSAVLYTYVEWKGLELSEQTGEYSLETVKKSVFWFPTNHKSIDELKKIAFAKS